MLINTILILKNIFIVKKIIKNTNKRKKPMIPPKVILTLTILTLWYNGIISDLLI